MLVLQKRKECATIWMKMLREKLYTNIQTRREEKEMFNLSMCLKQDEWMCT